MKSRRRSLLRYARKAGYEALVALEPENLFYMTGFWGEGIGVLGPGGEATIIAPELEAGRAESESGDCRVVVARRRGDLAPSLGGVLGGARACTDCRGHAGLASLRRAAPGMRYSEEPFVQARLVKDDGEVRILRRASRIIDGMFALCAETMREGQRESELQAVLMAHAVERQMFDTGYRSTLNPLIVAGGPNGALPHAQVTRRRFRRGDLVVVDITLRHAGYVSDATRTFAVGRAAESARDAYGAVKESQRLGLRAVRPGARCSSVDAACRDSISGRGLGDLFIHSTGHGIGLEVHEAPSVSAASGERLRRNMAITVEPGVYAPGRFGVRIEDSVIVGDGARTMHRFTKELIEA